MSLKYKKYIQNKNNIFQPHGKMQDACFSKVMESKRVAVHWIHLPPQERSSNPHAESLEEEFIYIVSGRPHVWINGYIYQLEPGCAVGFPSGTGIAQTFINNSNLEVQMIVLGQRTIKENKCSFPINPELSEIHKNIWWNDVPLQNIGPHDGSIGNLSHQRHVQDLNFIKNVFELEHKSGWSYPGDNETFTEGVRLTDFLGLKFLGIWHEILPSGKRASWPHAHLIEEEFVIILKGTAQVWMNGFLYNVKPGDCVYFEPGTNIAHTLINESGESIEYIGLGESETHQFNEKIIYPLHDERNSFCKSKNELWENPPVSDYFGFDLGIPKNKNIKIEQFKNAQEFLNQISAVLYQKESEYGLLLGLVESRAHSFDLKDNYLYLKISDENKIIGAALLSEKNLVISMMPATALKQLAYFLTEKLKNIKNIIQKQIPGVVGPSHSAEAFSKIYSVLNRLSYKLAMDQKIYKLEKVNFPLNKFGSLEIAKENRVELASQWLFDFVAESVPHEPITFEKAKEFIVKKIQNNEVFIWLDQNKNPVSINMASRPTLNGITITFVYTPVLYRKNGFATNLVALTSQKMLERGKNFCTLYTDVKNPTSNEIYKKIGYLEVATSKHYVFEEK